MSLPHVILTVLSSRDATGYDITKEFSNKIGFFWKASHQQVYRELNKMANSEFVVCTHQPQEGKPDRKVYSITDLGKANLKQWFEQPTVHPTVRDEFCAKLMACSVEESAEYLQQLKVGIEETKKLNAHFKAVELENYGNQGSLSKLENLERLTLRRNILAREAWLTWAEEVIKELS
jgi:PadR family transcriptional regulator AphA